MVMIPTKDGKNYIAAFTSPEFATEFSEKTKIDLKNSIQFYNIYSLCEQLKNLGNRVDGIYFNYYQNQNEFYKGFKVSTIFFDLILN
jgi:hypothetical protein